jgi:hypothetical protein
MTSDAVYLTCALPGKRHPGLLGRPQNMQLSRLPPGLWLCTLHGSALVTLVCGVDHHEK